MHQYEIMRFKLWHVKTNEFWLIQSMGAWSAFPFIPGVGQVVQGQCADNRGVAAKSHAQCQFSLFNSRAALSQGPSVWLPPLWCCSSSCAWSRTSLIPTLTWLHFLVWPGTCLRFLPRLLLALVTVWGLALPGLCSFVLQCPCVLWHKAEKSCTSLLKKVPFIAQQQLVKRDVVCGLQVPIPATLWVKPKLMVLSAVCQQF